MGPKSNDKCPLRRKEEQGLRQKRRRCRREEGHMKMKEGFGVMQPWAEEHLSHQKLEETAGSMALQSPWFWLLTYCERKSSVYFLFYRFQVYSVIIQHLCALPSDHKCSCHLSPYIWCVVIDGIHPSHPPSPIQCVCPLMPSCNTYRLTWVSLTLGVGYLFMAAPAKPSHCSLSWRRWYLLNTALPDLQSGIRILLPQHTAYWCTHKNRKMIHYC